MLAVVQRVREARVDVEERLVARIEQGLVALIAVKTGDTEDDAAYIATKLATLRIFSDAADKMNLSVQDVEGALPYRVPVHALRRDPEGPSAELQPSPPGRRKRNHCLRRLSASCASGGLPSAAVNSAR